MKSVLSSVLICCSLIVPIYGQETQVENVASSMINSLNTLSNQITALQAVANELSRNIAGFVQTGTRLVQGLQSDSSSTSNTWSGITSSFVDQTMANPFVTIMMNQVNQLQRALTDISSQVQRMIDSGSRIITGAPSNVQLYYQETTTAATPAPPAPTNTGTGSGSGTGTTTTTTTSTDTHGLSQTSTVTGPATQTTGQAAQTANHVTTNGAQIFTRTIELASQQMTQTQKTLQQLTQQMQGLLATGSRLFVGNRGPAPMTTIFDIAQSLTREVYSIQNSMRSLNEQFNQLVASGAKSVIGDGSPSKYQDDQNNLSGVVVTGLSELADQLERLQRAFNQLATEMSNLAVRTTNRILPSSHREHDKIKHRRVKRADAMVVNGLQRAAGEITQNLGALGGTFARIAGGMTGIRIPGSGVSLPGDKSDNRNSLDESQKAFSGLNPIGVIGRGVGNIASSLQRIIPTGK